MTSNRSQIAYASGGAYKSAASMPGEVLVDRQTGRIVTDDGNGGWQAHATKPEVDAKVAAQPSNPRSLLQLGYAKALDDTYANWVSGNIIKGANGGGIYFGLTSAVQKPSMWMRATIHHPIYSAWRQAADAVAAGDVTRTASRDRWAAVIEATWADTKAQYSEHNLRYGTESGSLPVFVAMDDAGLVCSYYRDIVSYYGAGSTEGAKALSYCVSLLINALAYFRDPLQTGANLIDYGVTDPVTGTAMKSNKYGVLYGVGNYASYSYISSGFEACWGSIAAWLASRTQLSATLRTAFQAYAVNTWNFLFSNMRTAAPSDSGGSAQGLYFGAFNLDPNINKNNNSSVNGGKAYRGSYDTNQQPYKPQNAFFGKPVRSLTAIWDVCGIWMGVLSAQLYSLTIAAGKDGSAYLAEAISCGRAHVSTQGQGRLLDGLLHIGNIRDPHSAGVAWPLYMRTMAGSAGTAGLPGFDTDYLVRGALIRTARRIAMSSDKGYLGPDWAGVEYSQNEQTSTWGETSAYQGGGGSGQAKATQQMTHGSSLAMLVAAMECGVAVETTIDTLAVNQSVVEQLGALISSARSTLDALTGRAAWTLNGRLTVMDRDLWLEYGAGGPQLNWYNNVWDKYDPSTSNREFWVGGAKSGYWGAGGFGLQSMQGLRYGGDASSALFISSSDGGRWHTFGDGGYATYFASGPSYRVSFPGGNGFSLSPGGMELYGGLTAYSVVWPSTSSTIDLGGSSRLWKQVWSQNAQLQQSDRTTKTPRADNDGGEELTAAELDAGLEIGQACKVWMRNSALANDGDAANPSRWHFGPYAQDILAIFAKHGMVALNPDGSLPTNVRYSCLAYSQWANDPGEPAIEADPGEPPSSDGASPGRPPTPGRPARPARPAGTEWSVRDAYVQWLVAAAQAREISRLSSNVAALMAAQQKAA
jgi:hypothetical protein